MAWKSVDESSCMDLMRLKDGLFIVKIHNFDRPAIANLEWYRKHDDKYSSALDGWYWWLSDQKIYPLDLRDQFMVCPKPERTVD